MAPTPVVTCFLRHRDDVLLLRRSDAVGSYRGRWGAVSGHVASDDAEPEAPDRDPLSAARDEVAEETGLMDACELVRAGDSFDVEDGTHGTWQVHPFLFDCGSREVAPNEETAEVAWLPPTEILRRETVPNLWRSYDRVRPTVETVRADREHGSAYLSLRALDVLRDRAGELAGAADHGEDATADRLEEVAADRSEGVAAGRQGDVAADRPEVDAWTELADLAGDLLDARPGMAALRNRVNRAMAEVAARAPRVVEESAQRAVEHALTADEAAAAAAAGRLEGTVLTLSRSGTVLAALRRAGPDGVVVAESRPGSEGVEVAEALADEGHDVVLVPDAAVAHHLATADVDAVLVGADTVLADGRVVNKVGTRAAALAAGREGVPFYAVAARDKVSPDAEVGLEMTDPDEVYDGDADVRVETPLFDVTPGDLVDAVVTEDGSLSGDDVEQVAAEHRALADWR